jgi:hypothetical protein
MTCIRSVACCTALLAVAITQRSHGQDDFEKWKKEEEARFRTYVEDRDREFVEFLKQEWKQMQRMEGLIPDEKPKPVTRPVYEPPAVPPRKDAGAAKRIITPPPTPPAPPPPHSEKPRIDEERNRSVAEFTFYGSPLRFSYDGAFTTTLGSTVNGDAISRLWETLSRANARDLLAQVMYQRRAMNLNDWGFLMLLYALGQAIYDEDNEAILFTWFLSSKAGFETKVGYSGDQVCLLIPSRNTLFGIPYFTFPRKREQRYYVASLDATWKLEDERVFTYDGGYPEATALVAFAVTTPPTTEGGSTTRTLTFSSGGKEHRIPVKLSTDAVRFFEHYPQTDYDVYFRARPSTEATETLLAALRPLVSGTTEREAVNTLLRFVQTAFEYKTDPDQFGREKPLFPDETLYYDYSDCEDRAILFAFLVRTLTGLRVIALDYPGHIATAVRFTGDVRGDAVTFEKSRYVICDPTYVNASAGDCMPAFKSVQPRIIRIQ